jgi:hypoxanthine phosphoribosyltransferase
MLIFTVILSTVEDPAAILPEMPKEDRHLACPGRRASCPSTTRPLLDFARKHRRVSRMQADLDRVLFDEATILRRLDELAMQISADYRDRALTVIAILNGSLMFMADLLRRIPLPLRLDCLSVASYHGGLQTSGEVIFRQIAQPDVAGRDILLLDDILDSGTTINAIREKLQTASPKSIRVCVLLRKIKERARPIEADYVGFDIADEFVVGYGLDYGEGYRNLPCIGVLKKELMA